ncbi:hypothetical protein OCA8868_02040 [Octadecabacter ascidiaceicola]|uniref:Uncharacterized protein n=1 Tax=Octadecabacter ascidiaceicola TaxID=1655543 RepID=A0A238KAR1_9RHOB|nr:hypothetical protein OCA8868_02040 [Octadecabacter ascidiaceicola]
MGREWRDSCKDVKGPTDINERNRQNIWIASTRFEVDLPAEALARHLVETSCMHKRVLFNFSNLCIVIVNAPLFGLPVLI